MSVAKKLCGLWGCKICPDLAEATNNVIGGASDRWGEHERI